MDFGFSDELSEDWISQPASAAPSLRGNDSFEGSVATSAASHGVHPKPLALVHVPAKTGTASIRKHTGPLQEKTSSDINVAKQDPPGKDSLRSSARVAVSEKKRSLQNDGSEYVADGTVQVAASPPKDRVERGATPEWRRRLINGQRSVGEQQDFFSPRGIERIFNKPDENDTPSGTPTKSPRQKKSMLPTPVRGSSPAVSWKPREDAKAPTRPEQRGSPSQIPRALRRDAIEPGQASPLPARAIPTITPPALPLKALRVRSRTVSGMQRTSREEELGASDRSPSERPSSRSSDSVLYNNHKSVEFPRAERGSRSASHQSAKEAWLSRSTNYITTSRGNADADDTFFLHSLSQISFADDAVLAVGSRQDHKQDVLNVPKSPLKLFAEDDSFTSKRLHRRVSQLEYDHPISNTDHLEGDALQSKKSVERRRVSNFGAGELDRYPFEPEDSMQDMPLLDMARIGDTTLSKRERILQHRSTSAAFGAPEQLESEYEQLDSDKLEHTEKKRFLAPPRRVSLAKRRRTSDHEQESRESSAGDRLVVSGRKRKDARYEDPPASTPEAIASRRRLVAVGQSRRMTSRSQLAAVLLEEDTYEEGQGSRKKSLTTADFFNEANAIMQKIRAQDHPRSSLASFKPLSSVASDPGSSILHEEFTIEQLSRPASWEGNEQRKQFTPRTLDARVVSHLRKFEDNDDLDFEWSSSPKPRSEAVEEDSATVERDPPNVRIRERNSELQHVEQAQQQTTQDKSRPSTQSSSSNSVPTGSSHGSAGRATISPDKVSHLINLTMGGMTFDQTRLCWVKQRASRPSSNLTEAVHSDPSEEDPLCNIPDLSVNESLEIRTTRKQAVFHKASSPLHELDLLPHTALEDQDVDQEANEESSIASDVHRFTSSGPTVETRATSWGDLPPRPAPGKVSVAIPSLTQLPHRDITDERSSQNDGKSRNTIRSHATQALSTCPEENGSKQDMTSGPEQDQPQGHRGACAEDEIDRKAPKGSSTPDGKPLKEPRDALDRSLIRAEDIPPLEILQVTSPLTSAHERDQSMQLTVSTPQPRHIAGMKPRHTPAGHLFHYEPMHLTPLPDFTVNQPDESLNLDMNYVAQRRGLSSVPEIEKNFSLAIEDLVGKITDIEPHEPYWEYMRVLDLKGQRLWTLHMLADFCGRIEELEISDNELGQLNGAPRTLRVLSAARNRLSGLTAWQHVPNLQYLDVSYNHISTLTSFSCLIHLRELNIEDNGIENLDGIQGLSGLISLKLGRNALKRLDFQVVQMRRLKVLDVRENQIEEVLGLENLESLRDLNLGSNHISIFECTQKALPKSLRRIDLSNNKLGVFDVTNAPRLDSLVLDHNQVQYVKGLGRNRTIRKLSWRHQIAGIPAKSNALEYNCSRQMHLLDLSENRLPVFAPRTPFLNLRRLEMQSCGIEGLGDDFGLQMPNLRVLNLNDNGLKDIRPLLGIIQLEELHIARNRLGRLRLTAKVLQEFASSLLYLDCRDNPVTLGFYPAPLLKSSTGSLKTSKNEKTVVLPDASHEERRRITQTQLDEEEDADYVKRLDEETLLRRRVYEALLLYKCKAMVFWDGLDMEYRRELDQETMWAQLVRIGVLAKLPS